MMPENLAGLTGLSMGKKKTRRGKRRSASAHAEHLKHMAEMKRCVECQDHKGAKSAAFQFIKALPVDDEPEMEHNAAEEVGESENGQPSAPPARAAAPSSKGALSPALRAYLAKKKKA